MPGEAKETTVTLTGTEKLTQKALEQHDKIHPKLQASKTRTRSQPQSKAEHRSPPVRQRSRSRLISHSESTKSSNGHDLSAAAALPKPFERQGSRASMSGVKPSKPGMSVFRVVAAARAWRRLSQRKPEVVPEKPKVILENTYKLGPEPEHAFKPETVKLALKDILTSFLRKFKYTSDGSKRMSLILSNEIKAKVKSMNFDRYKIVCNIMMMQNKGQGSEISSRCVWNPATDSFASYTHTTPHVVCVANVHALYFE